MDARDAEDRERIESSLRAVKRLDEILNRFKSFSHMSPEKMEALQLTQVTESVLSLLRYPLKTKEIECEVNADEDLPAILGDRTGLEQVFSNLVLNAVDAIVEKGAPRGFVSIDIGVSRDRVTLAVEDNGCGISPELRDRIFDPFFTTKPPDKGTGLGMAIIEAILHQHNATITFTSKVGAGTRFVVTFPALVLDASPDAPDGG
jgi:signal transduction histidine kinase